MSPRRAKVGAVFCDKDTQFYNTFVDPQPLTVHIDKAEQIVFEAGASRAE